LSTTSFDALWREGVSSNGSDGLLSKLGTPQHLNIFPPLGKKREGKREEKEPLQEGQEEEEEEEENENENENETETKKEIEKEKEKEKKGEGKEEKVDLRTVPSFFDERERTGERERTRETETERAERTRERETETPPNNNSDHPLVLGPCLPPHSMRTTTK